MKEGGRDGGWGRVGTDGGRGERRREIDRRCRIEYK